MNSNQILYLEKVAQTLSLQKAAQELFISRQALSISLRNLEQEVGFLILERTAFGVTLTKNGVHLLEAGLTFRHTVEQLKSATPPAKFQSQHQRIVASYSALDVLLPPIISSIYRETPSLFIDIERKTFREIQASFQEPSPVPVLAAIPYLDDQPFFDLSACTATTLMTGSYLALVPKQYPIHSYKQVSLSSIVKYPIVIHKPTEEYLLPILHTASEHPSVKYVDSISLYKKMIECGVGIGFTVGITSQKIPLLKPAEAAIIPLREKIVFRVVHLCPRNYTMTDDDRLLLAKVQKALLSISPSSLEEE